MASIAWFNLISINVWKSSVLRHWKISEKIWYRLNYFYGWLTPIIWVFIGIAIEVILKNGTLDTNTFDVKYLAGLETTLRSNIINMKFFLYLKYFCIIYLNSLDLAWTFVYLPLTIVVIINCILFGCTISSLHENGYDISADRKTVTSYR